MFTLKFYNHDEHGNQTMTAVSCSRYEVRGNNDGKTVTVYRDFISSEGIEFKVTHKDAPEMLKRACFAGFEVCFVENFHGKTIDTIRLDK